MLVLGFSSCLSWIFLAVTVTKNMPQLPRGGYVMEVLDIQKHKTTIYITTVFYGWIYDSFHLSFQKAVLKITLQATGFTKYMSLPQITTVLCISALLYLLTV